MVFAIGLGLALNMMEKTNKILEYPVKYEKICFKGVFTQALCFGF